MPNAYGEREKKKEMGTFLILIVRFSLAVMANLNERTGKMMFPVRSFNVITIRCN